MFEREIVARESMILWLKSFARESSLERIYWWGLSFSNILYKYNYIRLSLKSGCSIQIRKNNGS